MAVTALGRLASAGPVPVFCAQGIGAEGAVDRLDIERHVRLVESPRHAGILLVIGRVPGHAWTALRQVHDQIAHPRATVWWTGDDQETSACLPDAVVVTGERDLVPTLRRLWTDLLRGRRPSADALLPDRPANPWRGRGEHGQGGEGMMGGVPYGRPLAMTADDRDGLALDLLELRVGPFGPMAPAGTTLDVSLQGSLVTAIALADVGASPAPPAGSPVPGAHDDVPSGDQPIRIVEIERARARHHLRWAASLLRSLGLADLARRAARLALDAEVSSPAVERLAARGGRALAGGIRGIGVVRDGLTGPNARAAGMEHDARSDLREYALAGFRPIVQPEGDALARWRQRLGEAAQSLDLACSSALEEAVVPAGALLEGPRGRPDDGRAAADVVRSLAGAPWDEVMTTLASLDLPPWGAEP